MILMTFDRIWGVFQSAEKLFTGNPLNGEMKCGRKSCRENSRVLETPGCWPEDDRASHFMPFHG